MRLKFLLLFILPIYSFVIFSQRVAINEDGSSPVNSAILDIKSTNKGLLIPRMTKVDRNAIAAPAEGLMIFQTDSTSGFYYYETTWKLVGSNYIENQNLNNVLTLGTDAGNKKMVNINQMGIGTDIPHISASLEVSSINSGLLFPRMTTTQRNAIGSPATGLMIYNLTVNCLQYYNGTSWLNLCGP
jgi:hypothetical protein